MKNEGYINLSEYKKAIYADINLNQNHTLETNLQYYLDEIKEEVKQMQLSTNKGLKIYTNIDMNLYRAILPIIKKYTNEENQLSLIKVH